MAYSLSATDLALSANGLSMSTTVTTNGTVTASTLSAEYLAAGASAGAETDISSKITLSGNDISVDVSDYTTVGGTVTLTIGIEEDSTPITKTATVYGISLSDLAVSGDTLSSTVTTNDTGFTYQALFDEDGLSINTHDFEDISSALIVEENTLSLDLSDRAADGVVKFIVACQNKPAIAAEKSYTVA